MSSTLIIVGGRSDSATEMCPTEGYNTETFEWAVFPSLTRFRDACWEGEGTILVFGGFEQTAPDLLIGNMVKLDIRPALGTKREETKESTTKIKVATAGEGAIFRETASPRKQVAPDYRLSPLAAIAVSYNPDLTPELQRTVKLIGIDKLQEESKKLLPAYKPIPPLPEIEPESEELVNMFLNCLMRPKEWSMNKVEGNFMFKSELVVALARECQAVLETQPIVLRLRSPVKIFGDIHGQFQDLMRFFDLWRGPTEPGLGGDIDSFDYLFLGDYVDHGRRSLEVVCLLMALKVKYPNQLHLLRGHHEDIATNSVNGFSEECAERLCEKSESPSSAFRAINSVFEWLPLAGVVERRVMCVHGGIGSSFGRVEDLKRLARPLEVVHEPRTVEHQLVLDVLWSDTTNNDEELGVKADNVRDPNCTGSIYKYGPDRVDQFLKNNKLDMIVRSHECVMDGIERFAQGQLITVFSATDYCGKYKNAGAMLVMQKNYEIVAKLIYPLDNSAQTNWMDPGKKE